MDIKRVIKEKGFTINQVADLMGKNRVTLSQTISRNPTIETLQKIADAIGCRVGDFFRDEIDTFTCPNCGQEFKIVPIDKEVTMDVRGREVEIRIGDGTQYRYRNPRNKAEQMAIFELQTEPDEGGLVSVRNLNPIDSDGSEVEDVQFSRLMQI